MSGPAKPTSYEDVSYPSYPYPQTYPDHLAVLATLSRLKPPPIDHCRVLELGCGQGGNLIPTAYNLPDSRFVGLDLSDQAIAEGQTRLSSLGLTNINLCQQDILTVSPDLGQSEFNKAERLQDRLQYVLWMILLTFILVGCSVLAALLLRGI